MPSSFSLTKDLFGELIDRKYWVNNSNILTKEEALSLFKMTKLSNGILLYRATRDGFSGEAFHAKCDDKAKTVSIIKNNLNYVFGGYTSEKWTSNDEFITDKNAFIFSLRKKGDSNNQKFKIKNVEFAIYGDSNYGPTFGENVRIHLID